MEKSGGPSVGQPQTSPGGSGDQAPKKPRHPPLVNRKRTKTGCLTCRKRRIKCDEGRPICNNCIKSKRHCEGYNQRVIFKDPIGAHPFAGPFGAQGYIQGTTHPLQLASQQARRPGTTGLPTIAPRPPAYDYYNGFPSVQYQNAYPPGYPGPAGLQYDLNAGAYPPPPVDPYAQQRNPLAASGPPFPQEHLAHYLPPTNEEAGIEFQQPQHYQHNPQDPTASQYLHQPAPGAFTTDVPSRVDQNVAPPQVATSLVAQAGGEAYDWSDEDASIADSDDESAQHQGSQLMHVFQNLNRRDYHYGGPSPFTRSANDAALGQYMSTPHADELKSEAKRKLFEHFMRVTGPTMSLYERHPFDPAEKAEVINSSSYTQRETKGNNIWSHTFPMLSLQHPGLLHAVLALASLQVCHIQGTPATAAHKHYHLAIRRVAKNVKTQSRRLQPATLAATLLLAYFEVWNSEHTRWASHLYGARILFAELSLRSMGRRCLPVQSLRARQALAQPWDFSGMGGVLPADPNDLDYGLLTTITGFRVTPDDYCLRDAQVLGIRETNVTERDIETFENLRDLFWWYCKMDVYQSILGGTKLFMDYAHWTQCPPRAPISKLGGIYGTYDHLMLLLGRLAHFSSNDLARKRRVSRAKGPPPGGASPPPFPGMLPTGGAFRPPMGFSPPTRPHVMPEQQEDPNPQESYQSAVSEWESVKEAFQVFGDSLGSDFKPLGREYADPGSTPFGDTRQYRTFSVAGIWMNYYMGLIHLHRSHPNMPPTAMQSVGFAARTTAEFAKQIGRIAIGLAGDLSKATEVNTVLAAALVESAFCLFVAAVQYQDDAQRHWVVKWMHNITRLTGWKSARQIADGCESAWTKAAQLGKGPPYERHYEPHQVNHAGKSVWDNARRIDRVIQEIEYDGGASDRRIVVAGAERAHYALGLLGVEGDLEYLELKDETFNRGPDRTGKGA